MTKAEMNEQEQVIAITKLQTELTHTTEQLTALTTSVSELTEAWRTANGLITFVKWLAGLVTAVTIIYNGVLQTRG